MPEPKKWMILDANVLIDYLVDISVIKIACRHLGEIGVPSTILAEVEGLDELDCKRIGLHVIEPELSQLRESINKRGKLSAKDHLCLILCREKEAKCVTNDKPLRKACQQDGIKVLWGLEIMKELVTRRKLAVDEAISIAEKIHKNNPFHIPLNLVRRFEQTVRGKGNIKRKKKK